MHVQEKAPARDGAGHAAEQVEVVLERLGDPRVLHLDRHQRAVVQVGAVNLAEGCTCERLGLDVGEQPVRGGAQLGLDHLDHGRPRQSGGLGEQVAEPHPSGLGQAIGDLGEHLAGLQRAPLELAEGVEQNLSKPLPRLRARGRAHGIAGKGEAGLGPEGRYLGQAAETPRGNTFVVTGHGCGLSRIRREVVETHDPTGRLTPNLQEHPCAL